MATPKGLRVATAIIAAAGLLAGCTNSDRSSGNLPSPSPSGATAPNQSAGAVLGKPQVLASNLQVPWGLAFLPDRSALVGERTTGRVFQISPNGTRTAVGTVPDVLDNGEGGLLGLAVSPHYATDQLGYAYLSTKDDNRVVEFSLRSGRIGPTRPILTGIHTASNHNGGRLAFGPNGMLYVTTGDALVSSRAQDKNSLNGKILRITPDGQPAPGNPFPNSPVYTYGHRNVEGLTWGPGRRLYATEFGENTADEINVIQPGHNYGWPVAEGQDPQNRFHQPLVTWPTDQASPSGVAYASGALWVGALRGERLWRVPVRTDVSLGTPEALLTGQYGRIRTVAVAPDGALWITTSNRDGRGQPADSDDRVIRVPLR